MKKFIWFFPILFLIDNVLGVNGHQFSVFGIGIRNILFVLTLISLGAYCLYVTHCKHISIFRRTSDNPHILDYCRPVDAFVLGFLIWNILWATVVPLWKHTSLSFAINDFKPLMVLVLYFPCAFLFRAKQLNLSQILKWFYPLLLLLSLWHCIMYVGEVLAPGFYEGYYDFIDIISFGTAIRTDVVFGFGITRIIQVTSVFLIPAILLSLEFSARKNTWLGFAGLVPILFAILITYTKSIWFGVLAGFMLAGFGILIFSRNTLAKKRTFAFLGGFILLFCLFNFGFLNNTIITRTLNSAQPNTLVNLDAQISDLQTQLDQHQQQPGNPDDEKTAELKEQLKDLEFHRQDAAGTAEANAQRAKQTNALLEKWSNSKLFGYGYGAFTENCIRNDQFPYMYESLLPALLMKLGLVGLLGWGIFVVALVIFAVKALWLQPIRFWCWIGVALAYAMAVQTNPFLFTFSGMSLMLYLLLQIAGTTPEEI